MDRLIIVTVVIAHPFISGPSLQVYITNYSAPHSSVSASSDAESLSRYDCPKLLEPFYTSFWRSSVLTMNHNDNRGATRLFAAGTARDHCRGFRYISQRVGGLQLHGQAHWRQLWRRKEHSDR